MKTKIIASSSSLRKFLENVLSFETPPEKVVVTKNAIEFTGIMVDSFICETLHESDFEFDYDSAKWEVFRHTIRWLQDQPMTFTITDTGGIIINHIEI